MNAKEQRRVLVLNQLEGGALTSRQAAGLLVLSVRQLRRLRAAYREEGAAAIPHGNRGRAPANVVSEAVRRRVVELATTRYQGFNQQHLTEMLAEQEGLALSRPTVHRILAAAGVHAPRRRRSAKHRRRRDRYPRAGQLLQVDGSRHDWLEGRGPYLTLVGGIDDATGLVTAAGFRLQEDAQGYFMVLRHTVSRYGVPLAVYSDRHSIFFQTHDKDLTLEEQLEGRRRPTQFGRLLEELGVRLIPAHSPQAKGRIERLWGTFQDRLTSELRLAHATDLEQAERVLQRFLPRHNRQFAGAAAEPELAWGKAPDHLDRLFCFKYSRRVGLDHTVRFAGQRIDLEPSRTSYAGRLVELQERFDGSVHIYLADKFLGKQSMNSTAPLRARRGRDKNPTAFIPPLPPPALETGLIRVPSKPAANHPWRRPFPGAGQIP